MPAEFLSVEQRVGYGSFAEVPSLSDLEKFFFLDAVDRDVIARARADSHRLGVAVQIGTVRYKGLFLEDPLAVPWPVLDYLAEQLGIGDPSQVKRYTVRAQTAYDHAWMIRDAYGYHSFDDRASGEGRQLTRQFRTFLHGRAWTPAEGPVALFEQSVAWLRRHRVLLPGVTVLERLVGSVRERADNRLHAVVAKQVARADPGLAGALSGLLVVPEGSRISELERLRQAPRRTSGTEMVRALRRVEDLAAFGLAQDSRSYGQVPSTMLSLVEVGPLGDPSTDKITCSMPRIVTWADRVTLRVYGDDVTFRGANRDTEAVVGILIGYARCSTDEQDLTAQRNILLGLGVAEDRIYLDHGLTGTTRGRPGLREALAAVRAGDTLVVPKLDRLARSVPDAREIGDSLVARDVKLSLGGQVYDPTDPMGKMFFNILATFAEFEVDLLRMRTREGMAIARAKGKLRGKQPKLSARQQAHLVELHEAGKHTVVELAELFNVSRPTVYRVLERHQARQSAGGSAEIPDLAKGLPPDTRPLPDVSKYDELLPSRKAAVR